MASGDIRQTPALKRPNGATIKDVARRAGVSHITVSRVMNGSRLVVPSTAARVKVAARELGYAPNILARGLVRGASRTLGLLASDTTSPFVAELVRAICKLADDEAFGVNICVTDLDPERELRALASFVEQRVAGLVVGPPNRPAGDARIYELAEAGLPVVSVQRHMDHPAVHLVTGNGKSGSVQATTHLLELGHRRIAYIAGSPQVGVAPDKLQGYREALAAYNVRPDRALLVESGLSPSDGYAAAQHLLARKPPPSAILAFSDAVAIGAMSAIAVAGLHVPEDVSVIGFDDVASAAYTLPPLTTVHQPIKELGQLAARTLIASIAGLQPTQVRIVLDCILVRRGSTKPVQDRPGC
ncbi:MAG: LacI family DNA-binding transcriptional regulator [Chloroflexota bacterium]